MPDALEISVTPDTTEDLKKILDECISSQRLFVQGQVAGELRQRCSVRIKHPARNMTYDLSGEVVWLEPEGPAAGTGIELDPIGDDLMRQLQLTGVASEGDQDVGPANATGRTAQERIRGLSVSEAQKMALKANVAERVALERRFGISVWDQLLKNNGLTAPEVAAIARNGNLPQPLIEVIVGNNVWLKNAQVQRALLSNPRLNGTALTRVLRALPKPELIRAPMQTSYPMRVRQAARKLMGK